MTNPMSNDEIGTRPSPGGFTFGQVGWAWPEPRPRSLTFFLDGTVKVCDQYGRPIRGAVVDHQEVWFAEHAPSSEEHLKADRKKLATHAQVCRALEAEGVDWRKLVWAGWPQLPYEELKKLKSLPPTPVEELRSIKDSKLRMDALRIRREYDEARVRELEGDMETSEKEKETTKG